MTKFATCSIAEWRSERRVLGGRTVPGRTVRASEGKWIVGKRAVKLPAGPGEGLHPTLSIYQNGEHVAGLVQQLMNAPLVTDGAHEDQNEATKSGTNEGTAGVEVAGGLRVPAVGEVKVAGKASGMKGASTGVTTASKSTQNFVYSQAYYLNIVRHALNDRGLVQEVTGGATAAGLRPGDFVEYRATFSASVLSAVMDVLTPDLIGTLTQWMYKRSEVALFDGYADVEAVRKAAVRIEIVSEARAALARDVTRAVQADFRQDKTREYQGLIGSGDDSVTAITICDNRHFVVDDEDRILDGSFVVLGKVTSAPETDVPTLQRNKLLGQLSASVVDESIDVLKAKLGEQGTPVVGALSASDVFDLKLDSRVRGLSFRVMPIAIFV